MVKKTALFLFLFSIILAYFVFGHGWYPQAKLAIKGNADLNSTITARWDSGKGFNNYEKRRFTFLPFHGSEDKKLSIVIEGGAEKHKESRGSRVILTELRIDDKGVRIPKYVQKNVSHVQGHGWYFTSDNSKIGLQLPAEHRLEFKFKTSRNSGIAHITLNGVRTSHDLYRRNWEILFSEVNFWLLDVDGNFALTMEMPRYPVDKFEITGTATTTFSSISLNLASSSMDVAFEETAPGTVLLSAPNRNLKRIYNPTHFFFQIVCALLLSSILWIPGRALFGFGSVTQAFTAERRWLFWLFLGGGLIVYGSWLLAFWPGVMSVDSLNIWRAAMLPELLIANHPLVNEFYYFFLSLLWQNITIVPLIQIVLLSVLIAVTFFSAVVRGVSCWLVIPCYLLVLSSVPVGLYTTTLWKDIPFALLVILWALVLVYFYEKRRAGEKVSISPVGITLLLLSFLCLLTFRYNGLIYLFVIPLLFVILKLVRIPKLFGAAALLVGAVLLYLVVFPPSHIKSATYFYDLSREYFDQLKKESVSQRAIDAAMNYTRLLDIKKNEDSSDYWHYYLGDRYAYTFLNEVGWSDVYRYLPKDDVPFPALRHTGLQIYRYSLEYPWLYLSWYPFVFLYLFPLTILLVRWLPLSAVFSAVILAQVAALLFFVGTVNWRYYYFVLLAGYFLLPTLLLDIRHLRHRRTAV